MYEYSTKYCREGWFVYCVQSELIIQELQAATWAKQWVRTVPSLDRRLVFRRIKPVPRQQVLWHDLFQCACIAPKKETKVIMLLGPVNKLMCTKSFSRNRSKPVTGFEIPGEWGIYCSIPIQALPSLLCCSSNAGCCKEAALSSSIQLPFFGWMFFIAVKCRSLDSCFWGPGFSYSSCLQLLSSEERHFVMFSICVGAGK